MNPSFKESLKINLDEQDEIRSKKIDAYKNFVLEAAPGYVMFMELVNQIVTKLEKENVIGKTKVKSRIKAINSSMNNTDKKILDDIFGFEIITQNERDKEILMVIIHNLFDKQYARHKNHNKSNGYCAHHCTGSVKKKLNENDDLEKHILEANTWELKTEYRDMPHSEQKKFNRDKIFCQKPRYPVLRQEILEKNKIDDKLKEKIEEIIGFAKQALMSNPTAKSALPIMEMQFKTIEVEKESRYGRAQHIRYKKVKEAEIIKAYKNRRLIRGVDFPFTFIRNEDGNMEMEYSDETLINMWPFLENIIKQYHQDVDCVIANYDMYFAKVFPDLEPYVIKNLLKEPCIPAGQFSPEVVWNSLKNKIINNEFFLPQIKSEKSQIK